MRKSTVYIILGISVLILAGYLGKSQLTSIFLKENDFSVSDTAAVSRIEIVSEDTIILNKEGSSWKMNGDSPASQVAVNNFLFSFQRMSIKGLSNIPDITDEKGLRVKIFGGKKKLFLRFYDINGGSFMHKEGSGKIYAVEVYGFPEIRPGEVISSDPDHWKDRTLLNLQPQEIKEIEVSHPSDPNKDFKIKLIEGKTMLFDGKGIEIPENLTDKEKLNFYLSYFTNVFYDYTENSAVQPELDPKWKIEVIDNSGKDYELTVFPIKTSSGTDMFKALVKYNDQPGFMVTRYMVLDLILQDIGHFLLE
jgi:hypothetical protein